MGEALQKNKKYTYKEFLEITKDAERAEFIDGEIILQSTPILQHQNIIGNLLFEFKKYFNNKNCKPFIAPFDIILQKENEVYNEPIIYYKDDIVNSSLFEGLSMQLKSLFY